MNEQVSTQDTSNKYTVKVYLNGKLNRLYREKHLDQAIIYVRKCNTLAHGLDANNERAVDLFCFAPVNAEKRSFKLVTPERLHGELNKLICL